MILFVFLCIYWDFNFEELNEKIDNSFSMPILTICYVPSCKSCQNIPELYNDFIKISGNRTDLFTSLINCLDNEEYCRYLNSSTTPTSVLILGDNPRYWPRTNTNKPEHWNDFVEKYIGGNFKKIKSEVQLQRMVNDTTNNGGLTYYLKTSTDSDEILKKIRRKAFHFLIFNISFGYTINGSVTTTELRRFYSKGCSVLLKDAAYIDSFLNEAKFGPVHQFDYDEWQREKEPKLILIVKDKLIDSQKNGLIKLSNRYCSTLSIGWISADDFWHKPNDFGFDVSDLPISLISADSNKYFAMSKMRTFDIAESTFVDDFLEKKINCGDIIGEFNVSRPLINHSKGTNGSIFAFIYVVIGLILIALFRLKTEPESKIE